MKIHALMPDPEILKELGSRLARIRKQQQFSQTELAQEAGIGVATLRRIESGQESQFGTWIKLMKTLDRLSAIEALLPEEIRSPRAEAGAKARRRKSTAGTDSDQAEDSPTEPRSNFAIVWGDETP